MTGTQLSSHRTSGLAPPTDQALDPSPPSLRLPICKTGLTLTGWGSFKEMQEEALLPQGSVHRVGSVLIRSWLPLPEAPVILGDPGLKAEPGLSRDGGQAEREQSRGLEDRCPSTTRDLGKRWFGPWPRFLSLLTSCSEAIWVQLSPVRGRPPCPPTSCLTPAGPPQRPEGPLKAEHVT